ncbi:type VI secretion system baseplate subunit TssK [Pseudomonas sp. Bout1]|uniref:type VI secretion system baseplate subunit TssK n=1 Tax=Pseudomonas sp. Bout1 TaxID=3048600 RepID=UPI002AB32B7B|nr:type VI secretion system baseplate subunit TssK [Pseudomonas sp. Bout1]MDY7532748.1 type VI secretion system baseplate subunit TssK [Pseudomonas sp. Bout1]MEB0185133.1 type VI secretion system baseplate subunit TssK [Pseudomonas sp. Bout1]
MHSQKVIWQEGMLLRPQHFQQNDRYHDQQLKRRTLLLCRHAWGFLALEIDVQYLNMGKVVVNQASGILPDGSLFELGGATESLVLEVPVNTAKQAVYLALPLATRHCVEARRPEQVDVLARYKTLEVEVSDSNAGEDSPRQVICGQLDFRLLLGEQQSDQYYVKLKVAQVLGCTEEGVSLDADFTPTFIHLHGSGYLLSCLKEVISLLACRGDAIAERIRANGSAAGAEVGDFLMLQLINRSELVLRHYLGLRQVSPEALYQTLLSILGELATFASDSKRAYFEERYRHSDQGASFRQLMAPLRSLLSRVLEQHAVELVLQPRQYGVLVCPVSDLNLLGSATFVLAASAHCDSEELRHRLPAHLKVGPVERIRELVNLHLAGIKIKPLPVAPRQIPFHAAKTYFLLELGARDIEQLKHSGGFAFHVSGEFAELELKFWAIRN